MHGSGDYQEPLWVFELAIDDILLVHITPVSIEHSSHHGEEVEAKTVCDSCY